jgi:3-keto-5-aminohexanoate cleavage enzyme
MGVRWGVGGDPADLLFMKSKLPDNAIWSVLGVQKTQLPMITMSMLMGGHVRVGFEDSIYIRKGVLALSNAEVVEFAVDLAEKLGRTVATPSEARKILHIAPRGE